MQPQTKPTKQDLAKIISDLLTGDALASKAARTIFWDYLQTSIETIASHELGNSNHLSIQGLLWICGAEVTTNLEKEPLKSIIASQNSKQISKYISKIIRDNIRGLHTANPRRTPRTHLEVGPHDSKEDIDIGHNKYKFKYDEYIEIFTNRDMPPTPPENPPSSKDPRMEVLDALLATVPENAPYEEQAQRSEALKQAFNQKFAATQGEAIRLRCWAWREC